MGDPFALGVGIIAVLQVSQAVLCTCYQYISSVKNAPREIHRAASEVGSLQVILRDLKLLVESDAADTTSTLASLQKTIDAASGPVKSCQTTLDELKHMLGSPKNLISLSRRIVWPWKDKAVHGLLDHLQRQKESIALALNTDQTFLMLELQRDLRELKISFEQRNVLSWLSTVDPSTNHNAACEMQEPLTGNWVLESSHFGDYIFGDDRCLWFYGIPGCGKTILFSTLVEYIKAMHRSLPGTQYAYFYFDFNDSQKQNANGMLRSILAQLANQSPEILKQVEELYIQCDKGRQQPQRRDLLRVWSSSITENTRKTYLLLDALDECCERESLMKLLLEMYPSAGSNVALLATSRKERDIEIALTTIATSRIPLEISKVDSDIRLFVRNSLESDNRLKKWPDPVKEEIQAVLTEKAHGMFRWVVCQLGDLRRCLKLTTLKSALQQLPKTLDETYDRILSSIPEEYRDEAIGILRWLAFCFRPMTLAEVAEAIVVGPHGFNTSERLLDVGEVLEICSSLVTLRSLRAESDWENNGAPKDVAELAKNELRLAHFSVKEFLLSERIVTLESSARLFALSQSTAHVELARICLLYLTSEYFRSGACETRAEFEVRLEEFPFLHYAADCWYRHAKEPKVEDHLQDLLVDLLVPQKNKSLAATMQVTTNSPNFELQNTGNDYIQFGSHVDRKGMLQETNRPKPLNSLTVAANAGLNSVLRRIVESGADIEATGESGENALQVAVHRGNLVGVVTLLDLGADINSGTQSLDNWSPLALAVWRNHRDVISVLLKRGVDPAISGSETSITALDAAAYAENTELIKQFLKEYSEVAKHWHSAMRIAIIGSKINSVAALLQHKPTHVSDRDYDDLFEQASTWNRNVAKEIQTCFFNAGYRPPETLQQ